MAHYPKPFFRPARGLWYVQIDGKQLNLGAEKAGAFKAYHGLMQQRAEAKPEQPAPLPGIRRLVVFLVDEYLDWCQMNRAVATYGWYQYRLESFCKTIEPTLTVHQLKPHHVQKWVDEYPAGSRRGFIASIKRVMKWAEEQGYLEHSPLRHMKKPAGGRREHVLSAEQYQALLDCSHGSEFKDLITVTWETGCRPQESLRVEAKHLDIAGNRWVFPASESEGKRIPRVVYLTPKLLEISKRLAEKHPQGALFRRPRGTPWTSPAVNSEFWRVKKRVGGKVCLYGLRHTWINRMLIGGVDAFTVATLAGHSDPSMLAKHYAHLCQAPGYLFQQAMRVAG